MKNGSYLVSFSYAGNAGHGVVTLRDGKIRGGDSSFYYHGDLQVQGGGAVGVINVSRHSDGLPNVFGVDNYQLTLSAKVLSETELKGTAETPAAAGATLEVTLKLIAED